MSRSPLRTNWDAGLSGGLGRTRQCTLNSFRLWCRSRATIPLFCSFIAHALNRTRAASFWNTHADFDNWHSSADKQTKNKEEERKKESNKAKATEFVTTTASFQSQPNESHHSTTRKNSTFAAPSSAARIHETGAQVDQPFASKFQVFFDIDETATSLHYACACLTRSCHMTLNWAWDP